MRFRTFLALSAITAAALSTCGSAFAADAETPKEELRTGSVGNTSPTKEEYLVSCMALWDPTTHMTKDLWRSVCKRLETRKN